MTQALVLGGGGPVGRAWQTGLAAAALDHGVHLAKADLILGTSAGAIVGAEIALGLDPRTTLTAPEARPSRGAADGRDGDGPRPGPGLRELMAEAASSADPEEVRRRIGAWAVAAATPDEAAALGRANLAGVRGASWPSRFRATAVSVSTGKLVVFDGSGGETLQQALAASSALPGVWPPITIGGDRYLDGGVRSSLNVDVVTGAERAVVISCNSLSPAAAKEIDVLRAQGTTVDVIVPSDAFLELTAGGRNLLNPALAQPAFELGRAQWDDRLAF